MPRPNRSAESCPAEEAMEVFGGKWRVGIVHHLSGGPLRFSELRRRLPGITQKMLTQQLREMEGHKLITRTVFAEVPPRVEYEISPLGKSLLPVIEAMCDWGRKHHHEVG